MLRRRRFNHHGSCSFGLSGLGLKVLHQQSVSYFAAHVFPSCDPTGFYAAPATATDKTGQIKSGLVLDGCHLAADQKDAMSDRKEKVIYAINRTRNLCEVGIRHSRTHRQRRNITNRNPGADPATRRLGSRFRAGSQRSATELQRLNSDIATKQSSASTIGTAIAQAKVRLAEARKAEVDAAERKRQEQLTANFREYWDATTAIDSQLEQLTTRCRDAKAALNRAAELFTPGEQSRTIRSYQRLSRATSLARRTYRVAELHGEDAEVLAYGINPSHMIDETREAETVNVWKDAASYIDAVKRSYRRDAWQDQPAYCEIWSEKATVLNSLRPIRDELGVTLRVCHGFGSAGMELEIGERFAELCEKDITVFFLGDFDPSGVVIPEDIHRRAQAAAGFEFDMERLAIFESDIKAFRLPPQKIKASDSRAASFRKRFGKNAATVELDALPVGELRRRVDTAVRLLIDWTAWNRQMRTEEAEFGSIQRVADLLTNLPQVEG